MIRAILSLLKFFLFAVTGLLLWSSVAVGQTQIRVTVTADGPVGLAPVFATLHDGSYDIFSAGGTASAGLESLAEVGDPSILVGSLPAGVNGAGFAPGGPFGPNGGTGTMEFTVMEIKIFLFPI